GRGYLMSRLRRAEFCISLGSASCSAEGATLSSHGRKAVDRRSYCYQGPQGPTLFGGCDGLMPHLRRSTVVYLTSHGLTTVATQCRSFGPSKMLANLIKAHRDLWKYCRAEGLAGYDPYDGLNSRLFQATPLKNSRAARLAWTQ